jgi:hypothetical protein
MMEENDDTRKNDFRHRWELGEEQEGTVCGTNDTLKKQTKV